jgi:endonuclease III
MLNAQSPAGERQPEILKRLRVAYPDAHVELDHGNAFQLLVATILSAQCTDVRVNAVTPALFARYPRVVDFAVASQEDVEELVRSTGFFHRKAQYVREAAQRLISDYAGEVPDNMAGLLTLPGVSRKTANVVLGNAFGIAVGVVVDTHVARVSQRLRLTTNTDPAKIEEDLMALTPPDRWIELGHALILHGRRVCFARKPNCDGCPLRTVCPFGED